MINFFPANWLWIAFIVAMLGCIEGAAAVDTDDSTANTYNTNAIPMNLAVAATKGPGHDPTAHSQRVRLEQRTLCVSG